jgi:hypothetical protein
MLPFIWQADVKDAGSLLLVEGIQSIPLSRLKSILDELCEEMEREGMPKPLDGYTSEDLKGYLLRKEIHIPERFLKAFSVDTPDVVATYMWLGTPLRCLPEVLQRFAARAGGRDILVWVDVIFNDQRSPQAIARAVAAANALYMRAASHVVIFSEAKYPAFDENGASLAPRLCQPWDRCWCVLEMAVRDLAVRQQGKHESVMEMQEEFRQALALRLGSFGTARERIKDMFHGRDFFIGMQGRPEDVSEIQNTLLSTGFFPTPERFNQHMSEKLTNFFVSNLGYIMSGVADSQPVEQLAPPALHHTPALTVPTAAPYDVTGTRIASAQAATHAAELEQVKAEAVRAIELERIKAEHAAELERVKAEAVRAIELERIKAKHAAELERVKSESATATTTPKCSCSVS